MWIEISNIGDMVVDIVSLVFSILTQTFQLQYLHHPLGLKHVLLGMFDTMRAFLKVIHNYLKILYVIQCLFTKTAICKLHLQASYGMSNNKRSTSVVLNLIWHHQDEDYSVVAEYWILSFELQIS